LWRQADELVGGEGAWLIIDDTALPKKGNVPSLLGRAGTLNFGSTVSARRYLRIVLRDNSVRRSIFRIGMC